jgi:hypothetical protein
VGGRYSLMRGINGKDNSQIGVEGGGDSLMLGMQGKTGPVDCPSYRL